MSTTQNSFPTVHPTQQDFISTFPWGLTGDRVRILMQQTENVLLDAEAAAAMAVMLGSKSFSDRLDLAWKTYLNSQNHDIHVCSQEQAGVDWCMVAKALAEAIRDEASSYIAEKVGADVTLNPMSWNRQDDQGRMIPAFGYASKAAPAASSAAMTPWTDWFCAGAFDVRPAADGTLEIRIGHDQHTARVGYLTVEMDGQALDSRDAAPVCKNALIDPAAGRATMTLCGQLGGIAYEHTIIVEHGYIDYTTRFNYGNPGVNFGPDIKDIELEPRRTHYFQHDRKLCMNFSIEQKDAQLLYNSPFLTWPAAKDAQSVESLHYVALQGDGYGLAHMNIGQCAYARSKDGQSVRHALSFSPHDYIYGKQRQITVRGKHVHHFRFVPYVGTWQEAELTIRAAEYNRMPFASAAKLDKCDVVPASLLKLRANSTMATALFERDGRIYLRIAEWAGQSDHVEVLYGNEDSCLTEVTHGLDPIGPLDRSFEMRPWQIMTIQLSGNAIPLAPDEDSKKHFAGLPSGWERQSLFEKPMKQLQPALDDGTLYFVTGYHDGFVRPLEYHTDTMEIEAERTKMYDGYTNSWEIGGSCFVRMHENEPEYLEGLKKHLQDGTVEITGGTWCEPFSLIVSGESNIRQMFYGTKTFRELMDYQITIYNNQEHATYAQMPQILRSFGLYAVVNRTQWAPYGYESAIDADAARWVGPDGTSIWMIPRYHSMDYNNCPWDFSTLQNGSVTGHNRVWRTEEKFEQMRTEALAHGVAHPLMSMVEDIWSTELRTTDEELAFYDSLPKVKFISFARYLALLGITSADD